MFFYQSDYNLIGCFYLLLILCVIGIFTRYPNGLPEGIPAEIFNRDAAETAFKLAESTVQIITAYLDF